MPKIPTESEQKRMVCLLALEGEHKGTKNVIPAWMARLSVSLNDSLHGDGDDDYVVEIPVRTNDRALKKVIEWLRHEGERILALTKNELDDKDIPESEHKLPILDEWDTAYCTISDDDMVDTILAANLLECSKLLNILCITVANFVKGMTPEELRKSIIRTSKPIPEDLSSGIPGIKIMSESQVNSSFTADVKANVEAVSTKRASGED